MEATYYTKSNYGTLARYPGNNVAETIARLAGTKTLRLEDMKLAETLGITWTHVPAGDPAFESGE